MDTDKKTKISTESQMPIVGIRCPKCGCADFKDEDGRSWEVLNVKKIPGAIRRYMICRYCGRRVRTKEVIEK
ncbi:MAG: hypothetical protein ABSG22_10645 [Sedimentisphaerales bacterium]|jgi:transcriptional regulator NrdR family protein